MSLNVPDNVTDDDHEQLNNAINKHKNQGAASVPLNTVKHKVSWLFQIVQLSVGGQSCFQKICINFHQTSPPSARVGLRRSMTAKS